MGYLVFAIVLLLATVLALLATMAPVVFGWRYGWRWRFLMAALSAASWTPVVVALLGDALIADKTWKWVGGLVVITLPASITIALRGPRASLEAPGPPP